MNTIDNLKMTENLSFIKDFKEYTSVNQSNENAEHP